MKRAVLYLRVSKQEQTIENQRAELERVAAARNWRIVGIFKDDDTVWRDDDTVFLERVSKLVGVKCSSVRS